MDKKYKVIFGSILLAIGVLLLVFGALIYVSTTGLNILQYKSAMAAVNARLLSYVMLGWGSGLLIAGIIFLALSIMNFTFQSKKIVAVAMAVLLIGVGITAVFEVAAHPSAQSSMHGKVEVGNHYCEVGQCNSDYVNAKANSSYVGSYYLNVTGPSDSVLANGSVGSLVSAGPSNVSFNFKTPGNYTVTLSMISHGVKKAYSTWVYVYPKLKASVSGKANINNEYGSQTVTYMPVISGYSPNNYTWSISSSTFTDAQNYSYTNLYGKSMTVTYFLNSGSFLYGYNATYYISLTVQNKFGESYTYDPGFGGFETNVTGN